MKRQRDGTGAPDWWEELYDDAEPEAGRASTGESAEVRPDPAAGTVSLGGPALSADLERLGDLTPDTVLDSAYHGSLTIRAVSTRGSRTRTRGRPRYEALLTARFGSGDSALLLCAVATGVDQRNHGHLAAREVCEQIATVVGRSQPQLSDDLRHERRSALKSGLGRLTARSLGRLRASAVEEGLNPTEYAARLRCLLLPADPRCRVRLFFGTGPGGLMRLRAGEWQDLEPVPVAGRPWVPQQPGTPPGPDIAYGDRSPADRPHLGAPGEESFSETGRHSTSAPPFLFRTSLAEPGDVLLLCSSGLAEPVRAEAPFRQGLAERWGVAPPEPAEFLSSAQTPAQDNTPDRTAVVVWEPSASAEYLRDA